MIVDVQIDVFEYDLIAELLPQSLDGDLSQDLDARMLLLRPARPQAKAFERNKRNSQSMVNASKVIHATYGRITSMAK